MLKELRDAKGLTQKALSDKLGRPQSYVSKYELGERRIDLIETFEICRALNTDFLAFAQELIKSFRIEESRNLASPFANRPSRRQRNA
jgi:transcriptional regulator with XRE-family HTH domain